MKKHLLTLAILATVIASACKKDEQNPANGQFLGRNVGAGTLPSCTDSVIKGQITSSLYLSNTKKYTLKGIVSVVNNSTLKIAPGAVIQGDTLYDASSANPVKPGTLVITRGSKINATGTDTAPIVFTSKKAAGSRLSGDFGGVIILGKAPNNQSANQGIEGLDPIAPFDNKYGGTDAADNSGTLKYVRIEYAGYVLSANNEINGLTLGSVGNGTTIDFVQVTNSFDDSFEFFGGTVNAKHLVSVSARDDDFDFDFGYSGKIQFAVAVRNPNAADASASNMIECDNDATGSSNVPQTKPVLSNFTLVGVQTQTEASATNLGPGPLNDGKFGRGNHWRRNANLIMANSVIFGLNGGAYFDSQNVIDKYCAGNFHHNLVHGFVSAIATTGGTPACTIPATGADSYSNTLYTGANPNTSIKLVSPFYSASGCADFRPGIGSPALSGASFTGDLTNAFFTTTTYRGAFAAGTNWLANWANCNPLNTVYCQ